MAMFNNILTNPIVQGALNVGSIGGGLKPNAHPDRQAIQSFIEEVYQPAGPFSDKFIGGMINYRRKVSRFSVILF
jgi:hypothetical protein